MSYVVLARKYRPRRFEDMVGQDHVVRALTHALEQRRLHHAYLFTGTRGIGKTTVSRILAKSLNCTGADGQGDVTARPCGVCTACTEIDADRFIDYVELDAASNRSIDEIRDLIERAAYKPSVGRYKVFMIDEAHQLTKDAFNALLKTLEEPPDYLKFVLATTDPEKMLPTVLSRCLQFNLRPMAPETAAAHLARVLEAEGIAHDAGSLRLLSRAARGSMRDALSLADQAIAYGAGSLEESAVRAMLGTVDRSHAERLVAALAGRDAAAVFAEIDGLRGLGLSAAGTLEEMMRLLQQMAVEQALPGALDATDSETQPARALAQALAPDETQLLYSISLHGRAEISLAPDEYAGLVMVLLRFMAFPAATGTPDAAAGSMPPRGQSQGPGGAGDSPSSAGASAPSAAGATSRANSGVAAAPTPAFSTAANEPPRANATSRPHAAAPVPLVRTPPARAVARTPEADASGTGGQDDPPWDRDEPEVLEQDFGLPVLQSARGAGEELSRESDVAAAVSARSDSPVVLIALPPAVAPFERTVLGTRWAELVAQWNDAQMLIALVRELAMQAEFIACDESPDGTETWRLRVEREPLRSAALVDKLAAIVRRQLGRDVRLVVEAGVAADCPARRETAEADRRQREAIESLRSDPTVQALMTQFRTARIVPGTIKPL